MSNALAGYRLPIGLFRFRIVPLHSLLVPAVNKGNMLRGGFGHAFRRLCCVPECKQAHTCPVGTTCPYKAIFEPSPPPGAELLSGNQDIPRPFVFRAPQTQQTRFESGQPFEFELVLIGRALDFLPYFVMSFRELGDQGLGLNRAKCRLERVEQLCLSQNGTKISNYRLATIYTSEDQLFRPADPYDIGEWVEQRLKHVLTGQDGTAQRIAIRFLTPTVLKSDGEIIRRPDFHHVLKRLRDRLNALSTFFGEGPIEADFKGLGERAKQVRTVSCDAQWIQRFRTSSKTRQTHELSGFIGTAVYEGDVAEFRPWLAVGELIHIGKHTVWGMGGIHIAFNNLPGNDLGG